MALKFCFAFLVKGQQQHKFYDSDSSLPCGQRVLYIALCSLWLSDLKALWGICLHYLVFFLFIQAKLFYFTVFLLFFILVSNKNKKLNFTYSSNIFVECPVWKNTYYYKNNKNNLLYLLWENRFIGHRKWVSNKIYIFLMNAAKSSPDFIFSYII